jgi:G3E family GTPase
MKVTIVCGLLGAGKTSFIRNVLDAAGERIAVMVNDFGQAGIDGEILSSSGLNVIELPSGCVCCSLRTDLVSAFKKVSQEFNPDHVVIEPSGIASPGAVLEALHGLFDGPITVVGIVDASEFLELHAEEIYGRFFLEQVTLSDLVVVNKTDISGETKADETVAAIEELNPRAVVAKTVQARLNMPLPGGGASGRPGVYSDSHFNYETVSLKLAGIVSLESMLDILSRAREGAFGTVVRAKALVETDRGPYRLDLSRGRIDASEFGQPVGDSRLVLIGTGLDGRKLRELTDAMPEKK